LRAIESWLQSFRGETVKAQDREIEAREGEVAPWTGDQVKLWADIIAIAKAVGGKAANGMND
jgi:hypothetical protein